MLRNKKDDEYWTTEEMLKEQLYFMTENGEVVPIVHHGTDKKYYAWELAEVYAKENYNKIQGDKLRTLNRKRAFTDEEIEKLKAEYRAGATKKGLAEKYNKDVKTIRKYLEK